MGGGKVVGDGLEIMLGGFLYWWVGYFGGGGNIFGFMGG